jgi:hypothetical protein
MGYKTGGRLYYALIAAHVTLQMRAALCSLNFQLRQGNFPGLPRTEINFARVVLAVDDGNNMAAAPF